MSSIAALFSCHLMFLHISFLSDTIRSIFLFVMKLFFQAPSKYAYSQSAHTLLWRMIFPSPSPAQELAEVSKLIPLCSADVPLKTGWSVSLYYTHNVKALVKRSHTVHHESLRPADLLLQSLRAGLQCYCSSTLTLMILLQSLMRNTIN